MTDTKIYSKKSCQKIILKCTMKLLLDTTFNSGNSNIDFKTYIKMILKLNKYDNVSIITHLNNLGRSQIQSLLALANKTIEKYNYSHSSEFIIDDLDFKNIKPKLESIPDESQTLSSDNPITSIISLLEIMKRDNLMVRF